MVHQTVKMQLLFLCVLSTASASQLGRSFLQLRKNSTESRKDFESSAVDVKGPKCKNWCTSGGCTTQYDDCGGCDFCSSTTTTTAAPASCSSTQCKDWCVEASCATETKKCGGCPFCCSASTADVATPAPPTTGTTYLTEHNKYRCMHGAAALVWDDALAEHAQTYAESLATACATGGSCAMTHSANPSSFENMPPLGPSAENIAKQGAGGAVDVAAIVQAWYNEEQYCTASSATAYQNGCEFDDARSNHFTAMIWAGATNIGCGVSSVAGADTFYVCWYKAPCAVSNPSTFVDCLSVDTPNIQSAYATQVIPPSKTAAECR